MHYYEIRKTGCYLSTAAVEYKGLDDDSPEITSFRSFRDQYLLTFEEGNQDVKHYYQIAPQLVKKIQQYGHRSVSLMDASSICSPFP